MICSTIRQLIAKVQRVPAEVMDWNNIRKSGSRPDRTALISALHKIIMDSTRSIYLIIDAIDECDRNRHDPSRSPVLWLIRELVEARYDNLHLLITSRPDDCSLFLTSTSDMIEKISVEDHIQLDLSAFVDRQKKENPELSALAPHIKHRIRKELSPEKERSEP
jgi:hypothetical protein